MKHILRRFHLAGSADDANSSDAKGASRRRFSFSGDADSGPSSLPQDRKPLSGLTNWITSAKNTLSCSSASPNGGLEEDGHNVPEREMAESKSVIEDNTDDTQAAQLRMVSALDIKGKGTPYELMAEDLSILSLEDVEEYYVRVAMALSVRDDPEAAAIEKVKQISLGCDLALKTTSAEELAFKYWKYSALDFDDKVMDGFYDVYGVVADTDASSETMPALTDLQETLLTEEITWEVVLVNRANDPDLVNLEQKALTLSMDYEVVISGLEKSRLVQRIADIVVDQMGGQVCDTDLLLKKWRVKNAELRTALHSVVLPLGCLQVGLARHRALLFKVLADAAGIPCQLFKGRQYTGGDAESFNIVKINEGRSFVVDLMGDPGLLIPSDISGPAGVPIISTNAEEHRNYADKESGQVRSRAQEVRSPEVDQCAKCDLQDVEKSTKVGQRSRLSPHSRSPSWTEGVGSFAVNMKAKDASWYMMDAAKENPKLAQKLHNVLLESGVQAPPDLFTEVSSKQLQEQITEDVKFLEEKQKQVVAKSVAVQRKGASGFGHGRHPGMTSAQRSRVGSDDRRKDRLQRLNSVEGLGERRPLETNLSLCSSPNSTASSGAATQKSTPVLSSAAAINIVQENLAPGIIKHVPVAAAAAATAAVVASSMVVAAANSDIADPVLEVPVAAAATATAAVVVATSAMVGRRLELLEALPDNVNEDGKENSIQNKSAVNDQQSLPDSPGKNMGGNKSLESDRGLNESSGSVGTRASPILDDVPEILWEDLIIGERIGLGSYGEVYRGEWHGTEVAVKKFLNQGISGDALKEFGSEVRLMRRMRHPNVVLFMGAVMHPPNLSIVTEFLPRGSLYRLIHRPNNQLDERRRMRMALDVARGMNYLHSSTPVIVHRDLKSPNLLVDKNWVVKVCDFGLSRMKHNTFLSSNSTAGTPEWMAPEVLRNEPSNEKSDVYSFGVILWELATLQQPWAGMNPMQVVGAVGFQHRCLDIPSNLDPVIARIILQCWQRDPNARPSFSEIIEALKPSQRPLAAAQQAERQKS